MNDAYAVKVLTAMREFSRLRITVCHLSVDEGTQCRREIAALSCAIRALTGKRPTRRKTPKFVDRA